MNRSQLVLCAAALVAAACQDRQSPTAAPSFLIQDATHNGGNPHFYWLPPMTRQPSFTGTFDGTLAAVVEISELGGVTGCSNRIVATFTTTTGPGSETVRVDLVNQLYIVNWHTKPFNLNSACTYRIRFLVAGLQLGLADVDVVDNGAQLKRVDTDDFVPLLDDGTLAIKARVELGAVTFALTGDATACRPGRDCGEAVVTPVPGQDVTVLTTGQTAGLFIPAAALREQIIVLIESRTDRPCIPRSLMALPQFDDCYRYEVNPTSPSVERLAPRQATGGEINTSYSFGDGNDATLADNVTVGMCVEVGNLIPAQVARLDIFRFEPVEGTVNTLRDASAAFLPCDPNFGTTPPIGASGVLRQGWRLVMHGLRALMGARTAYASTSVIHVGLGGSTCCTSYFTWGLPAVLTANGASTFDVSPGATVTPSVVVKDSGGIPIAGATVTFAVGAGNGAITGANPVTTGVDGIAQVGWQLPSTPGLSTLTASAPGAAGSPHLFIATGASVRVDAGGLHSCALNASGQAFCWGNNSVGQLGDGTTTHRLVPTAVVGGPPFAAVSAGGSVFPEHTCGLTGSGVAYCWGGNNVGQLGDGTTTDRLVPTPVAGGLTFAAVSAGAFHTCGVTTNGAAYCWGLNNDGQLGDGTTNARSVPTPVAGGLTFTAMSAATDHTCGVTASGTAYCWGDNSIGELGDGTTTDRLVPTPVTGDLLFASVSAGGLSHTCGVTTSGAAYCWGPNFFGQLGDGTTIQRLVPTAVTGSLMFAELSPGRGFTCGVTTSSAVYCWGSNAVGQLGNGTTTNRLVPTVIAGGLSSTLTMVSADIAHACAVTTSGVVYCWGRNVEGQLGDGTTTERHVPTAVAFPTTPGIAIAGGTYTDRVGGLFGTAFLYDPTDPAGTIGSVAIVGPAGWNGGAGLTIGRFQPSGMATTRSVWWVFAPAIATSGTYTATASIGGVVRRATFSIDATNALEAPQITSVDPGGSQVAITWTASPSTQSFLVRVNPVPFTGAITAERVVSGGTRAFTFSGLSLVAGGAYQAVVWAYDKDVITPGALGSQFNIGAHAVGFSAPSVIP